MNATGVFWSNGRRGKNKTEHIDKAASDADRRERIAAASIQGLLVNAFQGDSECGTIDVAFWADLSVLAADELIAKLEKKGRK